MPYSFELETHVDIRGELIVINEFPFAVRREFKICHVSSSEVRGRHAHKECHQLLIAVTGTVIVKLRDGKRACKYHLSSPSVALYVEPMIWIELEFLPGAILQVFASHPYNEADYIDDYNIFLQRVLGRDTTKTDLGGI